MKKPLSVAVYSGVSPSTTFIERLIKGLASNGVKVYIFGSRNRTSCTSTHIRYYTFGGKLHKLFTLVKYSLLLFLFHYSDKKKLDKLIRLQSKRLWHSKLHNYPVLWHRPDIFHLQWAKGLDDWMWVKEFGIKLVLSLRGAHINYSPIADLKLADLYRKNFPKVDAFHAVSEAISLEAQKYGAEKNKISVVYSGLDLDVNPSLKPIDTAIFQIISVGRPHWKKGYHYALDACKILKDHNINFKYTIIGGAHDIELAYQVHDLNLQEEVFLLNQIPFAQVQAFLKTSNLLLLPSVEEGVANVVLEAMALKTMVLSTDCGGMAEVITEGHNGFLVPIRHAKSIAKRIIEITEFTDLKKEKIVSNAYKFVKKNHSEVQMVNGMITLYEQLSLKN